MSPLKGQRFDSGPLVGEGRFENMGIDGDVLFGPKGQRFFTSCGVITGKDGLWLRKQYLILAKNNSTPVPFWLDLPLWELRFWIRANNAVIIEEKESANGKQKRI